MKNTRSLGKLRPTPKTKPRSPKLTGQIWILWETLSTLVKQIQEGQSDEVVANLAAWINEDKDGQYLTIEISPLYVKKQKANTRDFMQLLGGDNQEPPTSDSEAHRSSRLDRAFE